MGGLFGGTTKTTSKSNEKFDTGPSSWQRPYLEKAFGDAGAAYDASKGTPYYQGDTYAGMDQGAKDALAALKGYASGSAMDAAGSISSIGAGMTQKAADLYGDISGDATEANIAAARAYADNPAIQGMIDANSRDVVRNLNESTLPGIDRAASATGNINSSRTGVAAGIAQRGAEDRIADISATIRGDAYDKGLNLAQADRAAKQSLFGTLSSQGLQALTAGTSLGFDALDKVTQANLLEQSDRQGELDAAFDKWKGDDTRAFDLLNRYYSLVGGNQWGQAGTSESTGSGTQKNSGNIFGQLVGAGALAASIASDRRLKKDIELIGTRPDGLNIYRYEYDRELAPDLPLGAHMGVMADEVAALRPEALGPVRGDGYLTVNYAAL